VVDGMDIEMTVWAVNATTPPAPVAPVAPATDLSIATPDGQRDVFDPALAHAVSATVIRREDMTPGQIVHGPAVVTEDETTIVIPSSRTATAQPDGCIDLTAKPAGESA